MRLVEQYTVYLSAADLPRPRARSLRPGVANSPASGGDYDRPPVAKTSARAAMTRLQMPLVCEERRAMREERGKGGEREVSHGVGRVLPAPLVGQALAATAQRGDQAILGLHPYGDAEIGVSANPENDIEGRYLEQCDILDSYRPIARPGETTVRTDPSRSNPPRWQNENCWCMRRCCTTMAQQCR